MRIKPRKLIFLAVCAAFASFGGTYLLRTPDHEVHVNTLQPFRYCADGGHYRINVRLVVGNTGAKVQDEPWKGELKRGDPRNIQFTRAMTNLAHLL